MSKSAYGADLTRGGFAARVRAPSGHRRIVRRRDLEAELGPANTLEQVRFELAELRGNRAHFGFANGDSLEVAVAELFTDSEPAAELLLEDARIMTCDGPPDEPLGIVEDGAVVIGEGKVLWVGPRAELDSCGHTISGLECVSGDGQLVTPGLVDCHAHPIFAGDRAGEFAMRAAGDSYQSIAQRGGGIAATVEPTRSAPFSELVETTLQRMDRAFAAGTTSCEAKSGYALTIDGELRLLEVACAVDAMGPVELHPTLLGAHVVPSEREHDRAGYVSDVADVMVSRAAQRDLATAVDVYCDRGAFTLEETTHILRAAKSAGLHLRAHVGQFADLGGAERVAELGGLSVDHLEEVSDAGIAALADAGLVAVMLPAACVQLRQEPPRVEALREAGVAMAIATDMNPGSSCCELLPIAMWLATTHYGMTIEEAWLGVTRIAARAAGIAGVGRLRAGLQADLVLWECVHPAAVPYECGRNLTIAAIKRGQRYGVWA